MPVPTNVGTRIFGAAPLLIASLILSISCGGQFDETRGNSNFLTIADDHIPVGERININTASVDELSRLPQIGPKLASEIVDFRTRYGPFRRTEHLMLIDDISEKRFNTIKNLVKVE